MVMVSGTMGIMAGRVMQRVETQPLAEKQGSQHERRKHTMMSIHGPFNGLFNHPRRPNANLNVLRRRGRLKT